MSFSTREIEGAWVKNALVESVPSMMCDIFNTYRITVEICLFHYHTEYRYIIHNTPYIIATTVLPVYKEYI